MFQGSMVALLTPFTADGIDEHGYQSFIEWQIGEGTEGLIRSAPPANRRHSVMRNICALSSSASR